MKISFLGDISLNDRYNELYLEGKNPFEGISQITKKSSLVIGNLESISKGKDSEINPLKRPLLSTNEETLNYLNDININLVCLANNHIYDYLVDGYNKTINFLNSNNIIYIGATSLKENRIKPIIKEIDDIKFCFLNYVTLDTNPNLPEDSKIIVNIFDKDQVIKYIKEYKQIVDQVIVLLHWGGNTENGYYPDLNQTEIARDLINNGADLIVGHHSHTFQAYECYKGKYIFYSLGNFCFSDIYNDNQLYTRLSNRQCKSIILEIDFIKDDNYLVNIVPISNINGYIKKSNKKLRLLQSYTRNYIFKFLKRSKILWSVYYLKLKKIDPIIDYIFVQRGSIKKALTYDKILKYFYH